jgi:hypothetical protein
VYIVSGPSILSLLWGFSIVANATAALRLYQLDLNRVYRFFFAYLVLTTARSLVLLPFSVRENTYGLIYLATIPILWVFYILIVLELYSLVLQNYSGIYSLGRWTLYGALFFSVTVSVLTLIPSWGNETSKLLFWCTTVERGVDFSLVIFLLMILIFLSRYPVALNRNIIVHCVVYTVFFLGTSMTILVRNVVGHELMRELNNVLQVINAACYLVWIFFLTRAGESRITMLRHNWSPEDEQRLIEQLNTINNTLLRAARK